MLIVAPSWNLPPATQDGSLPSLSLLKTDTSLGVIRSLYHSLACGIQRQSSLTCVSCLSGESSALSQLAHVARLDIASRAVLLFWTRWMGRSLRWFEGWQHDLRGDRWAAGGTRCQHFARLPCRMPAACKHFQGLSCRVDSMLRHRRLLASWFIAVFQKPLISDSLNHGFG